MWRIGYTAVWISLPHPPELNLESSYLKKTVYPDSKHILFMNELCPLAAVNVESMGNPRVYIRESNFIIIVPDDALALDVTIPLEGLYAIDIFFQVSLDVVDCDNNMVTDDAIQNYLGVNEKSHGILGVNYNHF